MAEVCFIKKHFEVVDGKKSDVIRFYEIVFNGGKTYNNETEYFNSSIHVSGSEGSEFVKAWYNYRKERESGMLINII
jgi:hypothetical protein